MSSHRLRLGRVVITSPGRSAVGVSHTELLAALEPRLTNLCGDVCVVAATDAPIVGPVRSLVGAGSVVLVASIPAATEWATSHMQPVSVVCYLALWSPPVSPSQLEALRAAVPEESRLFFVEPSAGVGLANRIQRWGKVILTKRLGLAFHRDIPVLLRQSGWEPTSVFRFSVGYPASVLTFVAGEARAY